MPSAAVLSDLFSELYLIIGRCVHSSWLGTASFLVTSHCPPWLFLSWVLGLICWISQGETWRLFFFLIWWNWQDFCFLFIAKISRKMVKCRNFFLSFTLTGPLLDVPNRKLSNMRRYQLSGTHIEAKNGYHVTSKTSPWEGKHCASSGIQTKH